MSDTESDSNAVSVSIYMPADLKAKIEDIAKEEDRSVSQVVRYYLRQALEAQTAKPS